MITSRREPNRSSVRTTAVGAFERSELDSLMGDRRKRIRPATRRPVDDRGEEERSRDEHVRRVRGNLEARRARSITDESGQQATQHTVIVEEP